MNQTVTLLLLLEGGNLTSAEKRALATFQTREKVVLIAPPKTTPAPPIPPRYQDDVAVRVEAALEEAQTLAASLDEERALVLLAELEKELILHPELPQAAWLMAERHQLAAAIRRRQPGGVEDAERLLASAEALEGQRATPFGEGGGAPGNPGAVASPPPRALVTVRDLDAHDVLVLDGGTAANPSSVLPGRHQARVLRGSRVVWAGWFDVPATPRVDRLLGIPERLACSDEDLAGVTAGRRAPSVPPGIHCEGWIAVRRGTTGLEVAWCKGSRCTAFGPLLHEQIAPKPTAAHVPPWLAVTLVGATAVGAATLLIATGTFDRERPPPVVVPVYRGPP